MSVNYMWAHTCPQRCMNGDDHNEWNINNTFIIKNIHYFINRCMHFAKSNAFCKVHLFIQVPSTVAKIADQRSRISQSYISLGRWTTIWTLTYHYLFDTELPVADTTNIHSSWLYCDGIHNYTCTSS